MRWTPGGTSEDIEDRRDDDSGGGGGFGFGGGGGFGGVHLGIGGTLILLVLSVIFRTNLFTMFSGGGGGTIAPARSAAPRTPGSGGNEREVQFVSFVLDDVQDTWEKILPAAGAQYRHAKLVLFRDETRSACGAAESATGPFYCPGDEKVYLDLSFFDELRQRFGAPGEFAQAYVIAHELGHHVQKILGIEAKVRQLQRRNPGEQNPLSVRMELQADCLAGVWGHSTEQRNILEKGDVDSGLRAAASVGDDHIQKMSGRAVSPESFTHGSSAQRTEWFKRGFESGQVSACNTFAE